MEEKNKNIKVCEICKNDANTICFQCISYFCEPCFKMIHDKKNNEQHKKEKIDFFVPIETKCPNHPKDRLNLFCLDEKGKNIILFNILY